ncbi:MAG: hypothetical protein H7Z40_22390 [Phycisphaerae bacterium]|nr:hypothetical protein [Gemmatimonadaceae bacterium]
MQNSLFDLTNRVAVVTGGYGVLGGAVSVQRCGLICNGTVIPVDGGFSAYSGV